MEPHRITVSFDARAFGCLAETLRLRLVETKRILRIAGNLCSSNVRKDVETFAAQIESCIASVASAREALRNDDPMQGS